MGKGATWANDVLRLYFLGESIASVADNASASPFVNHVVALHIGDPGIGNPQGTSETAYVGYNRVTVPRSSAGWTVVGARVNPATPIVFGICTASPGLPVTHFSVSRGSNIIDYVGALVAPITIIIGIIPRLLTSSEVTEA